MSKLFIILTLLFLSLQLQVKGETAGASEPSYAITKISGREITLDDGSRWGIYDDRDIATWKPGDQIQISDVMLYPFPSYPEIEMFQKYNKVFTAIRDLTQHQVATGGFNSDSKSNDKTYQIVSIDPKERQVLLSNGSLIQFDGKDFHFSEKFEGLHVGDHVTLLTNNYIFYEVKPAGISDWNSYQTLLSGTLTNPAH